MNVEVFLESRLLVTSRGIPLRIEVDQVVVVVFFGVVGDKPIDRTQRDRCCTLHYLKESLMIMRIGVEVLEGL